MVVGFDTCVDAEMARGKRAALEKLDSSIITIPVSLLMTVVSPTAVVNKRGPRISPSQGLYKRHQSGCAESIAMREQICAVQYHKISLTRYFVFWNRAGGPRRLQQLKTLNHDDGIYGTGEGMTIYGMRMKNPTVS